MSIVVWSLIGGFIGWAASTVMGTGDRQALWLNMAIGVAGAVLGGWLLSGLVDATLNHTVFAVSGLAVSFVGAVILLMVAKLARLA